VSIYWEAHLNLLHHTSCYWPFNGLGLELEGAIGLGGVTSTHLDCKLGPPSLLYALVGPSL